MGACGQETRGFGPWGGRTGPTAYLRMLTARAITSPRIMMEQTACTVIASFAQRASGITSVGLNAVASVKAR